MLAASAVAILDAQRPENLEGLLQIAGAVGVALGDRGGGEAVDVAARQGRLGDVDAQAHAVGGLLLGGGLARLAGDGGLHAFERLAGGRLGLVQGLEGLAQGGGHLGGLRLGGHAGFLETHEEGGDRLGRVGQGVGGRPGPRGGAQDHRQQGRQGHHRRTPAAATSHSQSSPKHGIRYSYRNSLAVDWNGSIRMFFSV
ncbi:MAG: hypothetical protein NT049_14710 [Planctomycetota bacterium]|nr:hypothetical protein [Planctomycetota bacterium]